MIEKAPTEEMGDLVVPQIHLKKVQVQAFLCQKKEKMEGARGD